MSISLLFSYRKPENNFVRFFYSQGMFIYLSTLEVVKKV